MLHKWHVFNCPKDQCEIIASTFKFNYEWMDHRICQSCLSSNISGAKMPTSTSSAKLFVFFVFALLFMLLVCLLYREVITDWSRGVHSNPKSANQNSSPTKSVLKNIKFI